MIEKKEEFEKEPSDDLEVVVGDGSTLNISNVTDFANKLRPQNASKAKKNVIIPTEKKKNK